MWSSCYWPVEAPVTQKAFVSSANCEVYQYQTRFPGDINHAQLPGALFCVSFYTHEARREKRKTAAED